MGKVLASELPKSGGNTCKVLYPASAKAGHEIRKSVWCTQLAFILLLFSYAFSKATFILFSFPKWCAFFRMLQIVCEFSDNLQLSSWTFVFLSTCVQIYGLGLIVSFLFSFTQFLYTFRIMMLASSQCRGWIIRTRIWCDTTEYIYHCNSALCELTLFVHCITTYTEKLIFCILLSYF